MIRLRTVEQMRKRMRSWFQRCYSIVLGRPRLRYLALAASAMLGLAMLYVADVWALGPAAASLVGLVNRIGAVVTGHKAAVDMTGYILSHPVQVAVAWATRPTAVLATGAARSLWIGLNLMLLAVAVFYTIHLRMTNHDAGINNRKRDRRDNRDIHRLRFKKITYDALRLLKITPLNRVVLGVDDRRHPVTVPVSKLTEHIYILGGTGVGKTSLAVLPLCIQAVRRSMPVIVIDFKGDKQAIQLLSRETAAAGKRFFLFSLHPQVPSNTYNPLSSGSATSKVERIMTALQLVFEGEAKFYTYCQQAMFLPLVKHFDAQGIRYTLADISSFLSNPDLVESITGEKVDPKQIRGLTAALVPYADVDRINDPEPDINLHKIMENADVCYFDLRSAVAPELAGAIGKMIAMDLQTQAAYRTEQDQIVMLAIDEFENMACQAFRNIISKVRSANYALVLANQALGDLRAVGEDFLNSVLVNTATKIIFTVDEPDDAMYFARRSGQIVVRSLSESFNRSQWRAGAGESIGESMQDHDTNLVHSNVLLQMPRGKSVIFRRGQLATIANQAHLINWAEKVALEQAPWPEPDIVVAALKQRAKTAADMMTTAKDLLAGQPRSTSNDDHPELEPAPASRVTL